jgi:lactate dehydrogenase-like 2-hydroxyacid dehydrogenase
VGVVRQPAERAYLVAACQRTSERRIAVNDGVLKTIGLIGAGHIGSQIARLAVRNNYSVVISNSRGPESLSALVAQLGPSARAATAADAAKAGDIVVVTVPLKNYRLIRSRRWRAKSSSYFI